MGSDNSHKSGPASVLVVEDEPRLREFLVEEVREMGYPACGARSAEEAGRLMQNEPRDILLLDLNLPGIGGMEFFQTIRGKWPWAQVIILTGVGSVAAAREAIHLDVVDFLTKPCPLGEIEAAMARASLRVRQGRVPAADAAPALEPLTTDSAVTLAEHEREVILQALSRHRGNRSAAAEELGISRRTLHYRLAEYRRKGLLDESH